MANALDKFPAFLLERSRYARSHGLDRFRLTHPTGDTLYVTLSPPDKVQVIRWPKATVPGPVGKARMRLATTERQLESDVAEGLASHTALDWRG
jgi:hypothetical protein